MQINDEFILFKFVSEIFDFKSFLKIRNFKKEEFIESQGKKPLKFLMDLGVSISLTPRYFDNRWGQ